MSLHVFKYVRLRVSKDYNKEECYLVNIINYKLTTQH